MANLMRIVTKRCLAQIGGFNEATSVSNHGQQWRTYAQSIRRLSQATASKPSNPLIKTTFASRSFSSWRSKTGFVGWYMNKLEVRPLLTKSISSSLIYAAADCTSQMIASPPSGSFDSIRTSRMAAYGLLILGPSQHVWFDFLSKILPMRNLLATFKKIVMGQAIFGPCITTVFFSYNAGLQGESGSEIVARLKRDLLPTLINGAMFWPVCDFITFKFVPVHLQNVLATSLREAAIDEQFLCVFVDHLFDLHGKLSKSEYRVVLEF